MPLYNRTRSVFYIGISLRPVAMHAPHAHHTQFGVQEVLLAVEAEIARQHVGNRAGKGKQRNILSAEYLDGKTDGCQRAVGAAAEQRYHAQRCAQLSGQTQQRCSHAAKRRPREEDRHDFAALEARTQSQRGEQHF